MSSATTTSQSGVDREAPTVLEGLPHTQPQSEEVKSGSNPPPKTPSKTTSPTASPTTSTTSNTSPPTFNGCSSIDNYIIIEKLGEGTFGEVHKASHKQTSQLVALKKILIHNEEEGFPITALREIRILKELHHENIIPLLDMSVQRGDRTTRKRSLMYMVTPYMDHDLTGLLENQYVKLSLPQMKCYLSQLLEGVNHIHQLKYLHRDIKASNILINNQGIVKIADFGLARQYLGERPTEKGGAGPGSFKYTAMVVTRWYRPPELILGESRYTTAIDLWGIGCVFAEMFRRKPILQGHSDPDQGHLIFQLLGSPTQETMPGFDKLPIAEKVSFGPYKRQFEAVYKDLPEQARDLLSKLLVLNPEKRLSALGALAHSFFHTDPPAARPQDLPKYAESHELTARKNRQNKVNGSQPQSTKPPHAPNGPHGREEERGNTLRYGDRNNDRRDDWKDGRRDERRDRDYRNNNERDRDYRRYNDRERDRDRDFRERDRDYRSRDRDHGYNKHYDRNNRNPNQHQNPPYRNYQPPTVPPYRKQNNPAGPIGGFENQARSYGRNENQHPSFPTHPQSFNQPQPPQPPYLQSRSSFNPPSQPSSHYPAHSSSHPAAPSSNYPPYRSTPPTTTSQFPAQPPAGPPPPQIPYRKAPPPPPPPSEEPPPIRAKIDGTKNALNYDDDIKQ